MGGRMSGPDLSAPPTLSVRDLAVDYEISRGGLFRRRCAVTAVQGISFDIAPGGTLGLIWNVRDESVAWVHRLTEIMHGSAAEILIAEGGPTVSAPFETVDENRVEWQREMSADDILAMAASRSYLITASGPCPTSPS